ncbi:MAG: hypothetical protein ACRC42_00705 [Mycoplasma sp.]
MVDKKLKGVAVNDPSNYWTKLAIWRKFATYNKMPTKCDFCERTNAHKTVLLEDGKHVCWYSWIKKGAAFVAVVAKHASLVDIKKEKAEAKKPKKEKPLTISEAAELDAALGEVDSQLKDSGDIHELTKLANGVLIHGLEDKHVEVKKPVAKKTTQPVAKPATKKETATPVVVKKEVAAPVTKKETTPVVVEKVIETPAVQKEVVAPTPVVAKQPEVVTPVKPMIKYGKYNPKSTLPVSAKVWNLFKYSTIILLMTFGILSLYFSSIWQVSADGKGVLTTLGVLNGSTFSFVGSFNATIEMIQKAIVSDPSIGLTQIVLPSVFGWDASLMGKLSLMDISSFTDSMNSMLMFFGILSLGVAFPIMVFKPNTICSLGFILGGIMILFVTGGVFISGIVAQQTVVGEFHEMGRLLSQYNSYFNASISYTTELNELSKQISELAAKLASMITSW